MSSFNRCTTPGGMLSSSRRDTLPTGADDGTTGCIDGGPTIESSEEDDTENSVDEEEVRLTTPPSFILCTELLPDLHISGTRSFAIMSRKIWTVGSTIRITCKRPTEDVLSRENFDFDTVLAGVKKYAKIWLRYANIYFDFIDGQFEEGQIRIAFHPGVGHYSHVGIPQINHSEATMNFDPDEINADIHPRRFQGVVLHQFGHVLGFIHKYSHPDSNINWDEHKVLDFYKTHHGWDERTIRKNILDEYKPWSEGDEPIRGTEFDSKSVMQYDIGSNFTKDGEPYPIGSKLSLDDKRLAEQRYPRALCNAGTFTIQATVLEHSDTPTLAPLPPDTVEEMRGDGRSRKVFLGVTRVTTDRNSNLRSDFNISHLGDLSNPLAIHHVSSNDDGNSIYQGSWLTLATSLLDIQSGHCTISLGARGFRKFVQSFPSPYPPYEVPQVAVWFYSIESTPEDKEPISHYFDVVEANPSNTSFQIICAGSPNCKLGVSWLSYSPARHDIRRGSCYYENLDCGTANSQSSFEMKLDGEQLSKSAKLFVAFSGISTLGGDALVSVDVPEGDLAARGTVFKICLSKKTALSTVTVTYVVIDPDKVPMNRGAYPDVL